MEGGKRKTEVWDSKDSETIELIDEEKAKKLVDNPLFKLEHESEDKKVLKKAVPVLEALLVTLKKKRKRKKEWKENSLLIFRK